MEEPVATLAERLNKLKRRQTQYIFGVSGPFISLATAKFRFNNGNSLRYGQIERRRKQQRKKNKLLYKRYRRSIA